VLTKPSINFGEEFVPLQAVEIENTKITAETKAELLGFDRTNNNEGYKENYDDGYYEGDKKASKYFGFKGRGESLMETQSVFRNSTIPGKVLSDIAPPDPKDTWPYRGYTIEEVQSLATISMAGMAAELTYTFSSPPTSPTSSIPLNKNKFKPTSGGSYDLMQLEQIFDQCQTKLTKEEKERITSQALSTSITMLKLYGGVFVDIVDVLMKGETSGEGIYETIEGCSDKTAEKASTQERITTLVSSLPSYSPSTLPLPTLNIKGDDPLYIAIFIAGAFALWAVGGGIGLH